ncbi:MAG: Y-family DNA polymerase [Gammaproteobacteria bacterium]
MNSVASHAYTPALSDSLNFSHRDRPRHQSRATPPHSGLWLHLHLPALPLEVLTRSVEDGQACVLAGGEGRNASVIMTNRKAACMGIRVGMPLNAAHALGQIKVLTRQPQAERRALERLAMWTMQISSEISLVEPDGLLIEIKGSLKLYGGLEVLLSRLRQGLRRLGYRFDYAVAPTPAAASVLARSNPRKTVLELCQLQAALACLPITSLRLERKQEAALHNLGVKCLGECRRLPREGLARRLSPDFLTRLDQLYGDQPDPRYAFQAPRSFDAEIELPWDIENSRELLTAGERLLNELHGYLTAHAATVRHIRWRLLGCDRKPEIFELRASQPTRDPQHLLLLLRETLTRTVLSGPVKGIGLHVADITFGAVPGNRDLFKSGNTTEQEAYASFVDRLRSRCGTTALRRLGIEAEHNPDTAWRWLQPMSVSHDRYQGLSHVEDKRVRRPLWLLRQALKLRDDQGQPFFDGPLDLVPERERIVNGWWDEAAIARDYFVARTRRGGRLWVYRELGGQRHWYLHGIFE